MLLSVSSAVGIALDVLIVALLVIFGFIGFKKGFFKSVLALFSTLVVIIISFCFAGQLAKLINKIYDFTGLISGKLCSSIGGMHPFYKQTIDGMSGKDLVKAIPSDTNKFLKRLMAYVLEPLSEGDVQGTTVAEIVSGAFASIIMLIISAIVLFIAIKIVIAIASRLFDNITRNRVFGATNKLLGFAFGAVKGLLVIFVFTIVLTLLTVVPKINTKMTPIIQDNTKVAAPIYNYTDKLVEKYVVDGKIVQKWIDDLWENKYKNRGNDNDETPSESTEGTMLNPIDLSYTKHETQNLYMTLIDVDFSELTEVYYYLDPADIGIQCYFDLVIDNSGTSILTEGVSSDTCKVYTYISGTNELIEVTTFETMDDSAKYIIKFIKTGEQASVSLSSTLTLVK